MRTTLIALLSLGVLGRGAVPGANAAVTDLSGKVLDENGQPVAGARVLSYGITYLPPSARLEQETTAAPDGSFTLTGLPGLGEGTMMRGRSVVVLAEGYAIGGTMIEGSEGADRLMVRLSQPGLLSGKVTGPDGQPLAQAKVQVLGAESPQGSGASFLWLWDTVGSVTAETRTDGTFSLERLPVGSRLILYLEHPRYASRMYQGAIAGEEGLVIALQEAGSLEGRVVWRETGQGVPQVKVFGIAAAEESSWGTVLTDSEGHYRLTGLSGGEYEVMLFPVKEGEAWVRPGTSIATVAAGQVASLDLEVIRGERVSGRVIDAENGRPVASVMITWDQEQGILPIITKEDGTFEFRAAPGQIELRIANVPRGYVQPQPPQPTTVEVLADQGASGVELKVSRGITIAGRAVGPTGQAVPQVQVRTNNGRIAATTDEKGWFSLEGVAPGQALQIWASAPQQGWAGQVTVKAQKGASQPLTLKLGRAAQVEVQVVDQNGKPVAKPQVSAMMIVATGDVKSFHPIGSVRAKDGQGTYVIAGLLGDHSYHLQASAKGFETVQTSPFPLKAGETKKLPPLVLRKAGAVLQGRVTDLSGKPVGEALIQATDQIVRTDAQGHYRIENLPHRPVYIWVRHADYEEDYQYNNPDQGPVNFALRPRFNPAKVKAQPGKPAPELSCAYWLNSERLTWEKLRGKVTLLAFGTPEAGPCERILSILKDLQERHLGQDFTVLLVVDRSLSLGELRAWVRKRGLSYPVAMVQSGFYEGWADGTFADYGVQAVPALFLIDRTGVLHCIESLARLPEQIEQLLGVH